MNALRLQPQNQNSFGYEKVSTLKGVIDQFIFDAVKHVGNIKCFHSVEYFRYIVAFEFGIRNWKPFIYFSLVVIASNPKLYASNCWFYK